jgi:hypothetical protein
VNGNLTNQSGTTLSGGTYDITGILQYNGANVVTDASNITLNGASSQIINQTSGNGLVNLASIAANSSLAINNGRNFTTAGNFTNNGTLTVGSGSKFTVNGNLTNQSGTTLSGGIYNVTGTLQYNNADIVTNAANIALTGTLSQIINQTSGIGLANFATNASSGRFTLAGNRNFTTAGSFSNAGTMTISKGSTFSVGANTYTQTAGSSTVDGTLTSTNTSLRAIDISGGSVFGNGGALSGNVTDNGVFNIGDALKQAGFETVSDKYTQTSTGTLNIDVGGTSVKTQFDQLDISSVASLNGILNLNLISGFVPALGETFDILNASSVQGKFSTVNGTGINSSEHFSVIYNSNKVTLDVVSGPGSSALVGDPGLAGAAGSSSTPEPASLLLIATGLIAVLWYRYRSVRVSREEP